MCSMRALMSDAFSFSLFAVISICYKAFYKGAMRECDSSKECQVGSLVCSYTQEFLYSSLFVAMVSVERDYAI
jgi:hypothetical protein